MKRSPVSLRKAGPQDAAVIRGMVNAAHINPFSLDWPRFLLAVDEAGAVVGCIQVKPHGDGSREMASLVVIPARQDEGIARTLIEAIQSAHPKPLYLTCRTVLQPLYRKFGFRTLERREMPPYFRRLHRLAGFVSFLMFRENAMAVMLWD
jgi:amino-acid N-acetyltransferase